jgi:hypothetical protein
VSRRRESKEVHKVAQERREPVHLSARASPDGALACGRENAVKHEAEEPEVVRVEERSTDLDDSIRVHERMVVDGEVWGEASGGLVKRGAERQEELALVWGTALGGSQNAGHHLHACPERAHDVAVRELKHGACVAKPSASGEAVTVACEKLLGELLEQHARRAVLDVQDDAFSRSAADRPDVEECKKNH